MSDWSSFAEDKDFADSWRNFLEEEEPAKPKPKPKKPEGDKPAKPEGGKPAKPEGGKPKGGKPKGDKPSRAGRAGAALGKAFKGIKSLPFRKRPGDFLPSLKPTTGIGPGFFGTKGAKEKKLLALTQDLKLPDFSGAPSGDAPGTAAAAETPPGSEASTGKDSPSYKKFMGYVADVAKGERPAADEVKLAYQNLSDEEKDEFQDFLDDSALDNPAIASYFTATLGSVMEQAELSLEELIKEELLRVLNEEK